MIASVPGIAAPDERPAPRQTGGSYRTGKILIVALIISGAVADPDGVRPDPAAAI
jgi:hypothetical protein